MLVVVEQPMDRWSVPAVIFQSEVLRLAVPVIAPIGNSIATSASGKTRTAAWKVAVASAVKAGRGHASFKPDSIYSVSLGFSFNPVAHGNQPLDVENFMKPTLDALAAGLFCEESRDPASITRFAYDDSNFRYLFVHRLPDAPSAQTEGAGIVVSIRKET